MFGASIALLVLGVVFGTACATTLVVAVAVRRYLPWTISRRLLAGRHYVRHRTSPARGAWNPAKPLGRRNRLNAGHGWATYQVTEDGQIRLELLRADGSVTEFVGPAVPPPASSSALRLAGWIPVVSYPLCVAAGAGVGLGVGGRGVADGLLGGLAGWAVVWFGLAGISVVGRVRRQRGLVGDRR